MAHIQIGKYPKNGKNQQWHSSNKIILMPGVTM